MSERNDGGPAFPGGVNQVYTNMEQGEPTQSGMNLRDYFAARAMTLLDADEGGSVGDICKIIGIEVADYRWQKHWPMYVAQRAYAMADAMLAARERS